MRIYHLLSTNHAINNIELRRIKVARYADLNDPFELMAANLRNKIFRRAVATLKKEFNKNKGLLCFTKNWENPVIWSHYADKHRGTALGFDIQDDYISLIKYSKTRLPVKFKDDKQQNELDSGFVNDLLYTKYEHWKYEEEVRLHVDLNSCEEDCGLYFTRFVDVGLELREVILGHSCVFPIEKMRKLINVIKGRLAFGDFKITPDQRSVSD